MSQEFTLNQLRRTVRLQSRLIIALAVLLGLNSAALTYVILQMRELHHRVAP